LYTLVYLKKPRNSVYLVILLVIIFYVYLFAPTSDPSSLLLIRKMYSVNYHEVNPLVFSVFNLMGVWPMIYSLVLIFEAEKQTVPVWLFIFLSFFLGGFILLIYYSYRIPQTCYPDKFTRAMKIAEKKRNSVVLGITGLALVLYGIIYGDYSDYFYLFNVNSLVHVMSIDFLLVTFLFPVILRDDMQRRDFYKPTLYALFSVPLLGPILYLLVRPKQTKNNSSNRV